MKAFSFLGAGFPGHSIIHRLDARLKLIAAITLMVVLLLARDPRILAAMLVVTLAFILLSKIPFRLVARSVKPILWIVLFAFVLHIFTADGEILWQLGFIRITKEGLFGAVTVSLRLIMLVLNTALFLSLTTPPIMLTDAVEKLLSPLRFLRFPVHEFAMMMSIALRFVPTLLEEADKIMKAQSSRGASYDTGSALKKMRGFVSILVPLFVSSFRRADDLATAMEARCYRGEQGRTKRPSQHFKMIDVIFAAILVLLVLLVAVVQPRLPQFVL